MIKGRNLKISIQDYTVACARSCEVNISNSTIEVASPSSGQWREYVKGRTGWTVSVSGLVSTSDKFNLLSLINDSTLLELTFTNGTKSLSGDCICTSVKYTGTLGNIAQYSAEFQGTGILG